MQIAGFRGSDSFIFGVSDGAASAQARIEITVGGDAAVSASDDDYNFDFGRGESNPAKRRSCC